MKASEIFKIKADGNIFRNRSSATMRTAIDSQRRDWLLQPLEIERGFYEVPVKTQNEMVKRTARGGFKHLRDNDLLNLGGTVLLAMDGNTNFATPDPALAAVQAAYDDYKAKLEAASRKGGPLEKSLKNDAREVLLALLKRLAYYVSGVADGSLSVILSSGFPPSGTPVRQLPPFTPERVRLSDYRQSGQMQLGFEAVPGAWLYEYAYSSDRLPDGTVVWPEPLVARSSRGNVIAPVIPGTTYYARVRARNGAGVSDWSEPVSLIAR